MDLEIAAILLSVVLCLIYVSADSFAFKAQVGNRYTVGPRDQDVRPNQLSGRLRRASQNYLETYPAFLAVTFLVLITMASGPFSNAGCCLYLLGRVVYLPLYASGVYWLRSIAWKVSTFGIVLIGTQVVVSLSA